MKLSGGTSDNVVSFKTRPRHISSFLSRKNWHLQILEMYNICLSPQQGPSNLHINFSHKRTKNAFCSFAVVVLPQRMSCFTHSLHSKGIASRTHTKHRGPKFETQLRLIKVAQCFSAPSPPPPPPATPLVIEPWRRIPRHLSTVKPDSCVVSKVGVASIQTLV